MEERERKKQTATSSSSKKLDWRDLADEELKYPSGGQSYSSSDSYNDPTEQLFVRYPDHPARSGYEW